MPGFVNATDSDSTTSPAPAGQAPRTNSASRCGPATANGVNDYPAPCPAPTSAALPAGSGTTSGTEACNTSSTCTDVPGSARCNAARTWASVCSSAPSAYRPDIETDSHGSSANRRRIPSVTELAVNTTPCCPAQRTPAGAPRPVLPSW
ncbi:hypothetical protein [Kitasatospora fiedleri]|uniref:hypothetical protein n=1 Tax=Kitasatospora fiedleri TaxID=2991545 RepID=UPI00249ADDFD|nr:hypothetical protein [Kitasatospora fiedleri]